MRLGGRLKIAREHRGLKQEELATLASTHATISQAAISALESRDSETTTYLFAFARALRVNPEWLQTGKGISGLDDNEWRPEGTVDPHDRERVLELLRDLYSLCSKLFGAPPAVPLPEISIDEAPMHNNIGGELQRRDRAKK